MASAVTHEMKATLSLDELTQTVEYKRLSPKMRMWVATYVQNYIDNDTLDPLFATKTAYQCSSEESARTLGYQLLANPKIIFALNRFFGMSQEQAFLKAIEKAIYNNRLSVAQVKALTLYYQAMGWSTDGLPKFNSYTPVAAREPKHFIGEIVRQKGIRYRVTAVDGGGKITGAEEVGNAI